jgi:hypothetical protein
MVKFLIPILVPFLLPCHAETPVIDLDNMGSVEAQFCPNTFLYVILWHVQDGKAEQLSALKVQRGMSTIFNGETATKNHPILSVSFHLLTEFLDDDKVRYYLKKESDILLSGSDKPPLSKSFGFSTIRGSYRSLDFTPQFNFVENTEYLLFAQGTTDFKATFNTPLSYFVNVSINSSSNFIVLTMTMGNRCSNQ